MTETEIIDTQGSSTNGQELDVYRPQQALKPVVFTSEQIEILRKNLCPKRGDTPGLTDDELQFAIARCQAMRLDPFRREVYVTKDRQGRVTFMIGIDGYLKHAAATGKYRGTVGPLFSDDGKEWTDVWIPKAPPAACKIGIYRSDHTEPIWLTIATREFMVEANPNWKSRPCHMLGIRALAHNLRRNIPEASWDGMDLLEDGVEAPATATRIVDHGQAALPGVVDTAPAPVPDPKSRDPRKAWFALFREHFGAVDDETRYALVKRLHALKTTPTTQGDWDDRKWEFSLGVLKAHAERCPVHQEGGRCDVMGLATDDLLEKMRTETPAAAAEKHGSYVEATLIPPAEAAPAAEQEADQGDDPFAEE